MYGQARLNRNELRYVPVGNQNTPNRFSIMELQTIKAAAVACGVSDWWAKTDSSLSYEENVTRMEELGTALNGSGPSMRDIYAREKLLIK